MTSHDITHNKIFKYPLVCLKKVLGGIFVLFQSNTICAYSIETMQTSEIMCETHAIVKPMQNYKIQDQT